MSVRPSDCAKFGIQVTVDMYILNVATHLIYNNNHNNNTYYYYYYYYYYYEYYCCYY